METKTRQLIALGLIILNIALLIIFKKEPMEGPAPVDENVLGCYVQVLGKDVYTLNIKTLNSGMTTGELAFKNFEKDSSSGTFYGKYENEVLLADYKFNSEGSESIRQVAFKKVGDDFVEGFGPVEVAGGREAFTSTSEIVYDVKNTFIKSPDCVPPVVVKQVGYRNEAQKISFSHGSNYYLKEMSDAGTEESPHFKALLVLDTPENRAVIDGTATDVREGPVSMSVDVYPNTDKLTVKDWVAQDPNRKLSNSVTTKTLVGGVEGLTYTWSGLYEGKTIVAAKGTKIYVFNGTYMDPADPIRNDFDKLVKSVTFK